MPRLSAGNEVESEVHVPGWWLVFLAGALFLILGIGAFLAIGRNFAPGLPIWIARLSTALFALIGAVPFAHALQLRLRPTRVRHAAPEVLPDVPNEPVPREGSVVHGRLTHELAEAGQGLEFRPAARHWRNDLRFILGFGIPFLTFFAGLLTWEFHDRLGWVVGAVAAIGLTLLSGGTAGLLIGMILRAGYRRLGRLSIPRDGGDLQLDLPQEPDADSAVGLRRDDARKHSADLAEGLRWVFLGETKRQQLTIPRNLVAAVQLCPWLYKVGSSSTWAVQGLLVLTLSAGNVRHRLPLFLTSDFAGAARLIERLAEALDVPFLFGADAAGWKAEELRARTRPPQRTGGSQS
jgi:hypothetical protein